MNASMNARKISVLLFTVTMIVGCAQNSAFKPSSNLKFPRMERELNYYVATHPFHATNHFFVYSSDWPTSAEVYWKEERTILHYNELEPDAVHDVFAWNGREVKLDRDTVDTQEEIGGSDYLETHRDWAESVQRCISKGKRFSILKADAQRFFPNEQGDQK
jgi:hypothetical protein